jgi:hypothetical protein
MITLLIQDSENKRIYCSTSDPELATHYQTDLDDSGVKLITPSILQELRIIKNDSIVEPLLMPVMNFGKKKEEKQAVINIDNGSDVQPLLMPVMKF